MTKDEWKGRQLYPKDTVSQKKLDRVDDRLTRRIDHQKERNHKLQSEVADLQQAVEDWKLILQGFMDSKKKQS